MTKHKSEQNENQTKDLSKSADYELVKRTIWHCIFLSSPCSCYGNPYCTFLESLQLVLPDCMAVE